MPVPIKDNQESKKDLRLMEESVPLNFSLKCLLGQNVNRALLSSKSTLWNGLDASGLRDSH